jgi:hypothetical protein
MVILAVATIFLLSVALFEYAQISTLRASTTTSMSTVTTTVTNSTTITLTTTSEALVEVQISTVTSSSKLSTVTSISTIVAATTCAYNPSGLCFFGKTGILDISGQGIYDYILATSAATNVIVFNNVTFAPEPITPNGLSYCMNFNATLASGSSYHLENCIPNTVGGPPEIEISLYPNGIWLVGTMLLPDGSFYFLVKAD